MDGSAVSREKLARHLARSSVKALAVYGVGAALTYLAQLIIARVIGAEAYGTYAYVFAWMTVLAYVAALGFDVSLMRLVPSYTAQGRSGLVRGVIHYAIQRSALAGLSMVLAGVAILLIAPGALSSDRGITFLAGLPLIPVWASLWVRSAAVRSYGGVITALAPDRVLRDGCVVVLVGLTALILPARAHGAAFAMTVTLIGSVAGLALIAWVLRRLHPSAVAAAMPEFAPSVWRSCAVPIVVISLSETVMNRTGVVLLGWSGHTTEAGVYALVFTLASAVLLPRTAINAMFAPLAARLYSRGDRVALQHLVTRSALGSFACAACIVLPIAIFATPLLAMFGAGFTQGAGALRILLLGQLIAAAAGPQMHLLLMTGNEKSAAFLMVAGAIANAGAAVLLSGSWGVAGTASAMTGTLAVLNCGMALAVWRRVGVMPAGSGILTALPALVHQSGD
jgi:O-antigen/teichoic acid export membrane protein